jgi:quinol monooxygenase YgiN
MFVTLVHIHVKPDQVETFLDATRANHEASIREDGNVRFDVLRSIEDPTRFVLYEWYVDEAAAARHRRRPTTPPGATRPRTCSWNLATGSAMRGSTRRRRSRDDRGWAGRAAAQRVRGKPRSTVLVAGSGQREVTTFDRV